MNNHFIHSSNTRISSSSAPSFSEEEKVFQKKNSLKTAADVRIEEIQQKALNHALEIVPPILAKELDSSDLLLKMTALVNSKTSMRAIQFRELYNLVMDNDFNAVEQEYVYKLLEGKFREIEFAPTSQAWVQRADLLDALDALIKKYPEHPPLSIGLPPSEAPWKEGTIPLIPYSKVKQATLQLSLGKKNLQTLSDVQEHLHGSVIGEHTDTARMIQKLTKRHLMGAGLLNIFYRFLTRVVGMFYQQPHAFGKTLDQISHFSQKMGIQSIEVLSKKCTINGQKVEQFYYRGPRYLFGQSVYDYRSVNNWFKRDLSEEARQAYRIKAQYKEEKLTARYGKSEEEVSRVVISNSDSRLRFEEIQPGEFGKAQELTGKVLNQEAEDLARVKRDDPSYYADEYKFSTKNLLGREIKDSMLPKELSVQQRSQLDKQIDKLLSMTSSDRSKAKLRQAILKQKNTQQLLVQAQHELLGGIYRAFEEEGAVQVIQRLAPADIHNYVAPLNGTPLSNLQAVTLLKQRLLEKQAYLAENQPMISEIEKSHVQREIGVFEELEKVFLQQEILLERPSQSTIDIYGTNASVSTTAIKNQARILAQNDRKVRLFKHEDGSFSLHVFIGATGVNRVDVDPSHLPKKQAEREGDMQFGRDTYRSKGEFKAASDATTKDGLNKLRLGERVGGFPINGSTVISYYLPTDFALLSKVKQFKEVASYGQEGLQRTNIELQTKMGDPLLVKTEIALISFLEKSFPSLFVDYRTAEDILCQIPSLKLSVELKSSSRLNSDQKALDLLQKLWPVSTIDNFPPLTLEETKLKERVHKLLEKRLVIIQEQERVAEEHGTTEEDILALQELEEINERERQLA